MLQREGVVTTRLANWALKRIVRASRPLTTQSKDSAPLGTSISACCQLPGVRMTDSRREISTSSRAASGERFRLTMETINPFVKNMEYAVRGKMPQEAAKIEAAIKKVSFIEL